MTYEYHMAKKSVPLHLRAHLIASDHSPTTFYYGRAVLSVELSHEEQIENGLYLVDEDTDANERESNRLYDNEMRLGVAGY